MSNIPKIAENAANQVTITLPGGKWIAFSYLTPVAFYTHKTGRQVCSNAWGVTTGRHLNRIDGGTKEAIAARLPLDEFRQAIEQAFA